jgi:hypothetical protein
MSRIEELPPDDPSVPAVSNLSLVPRTSAPSSSSSSQRQQDASAVLHLLHALTMPVFTISFTVITTTTTTSYAPAPQRREHVGKVIPKKQRALPAAPSSYSPKRKAQLALPAPSSSKEEGEEREPVEKKQKTQPAPSAFQRLMAPKRETKPSSSSSPSSSSPSSPYVVHCMRGRYDVYIGRPNPRVPRSLSGTGKWGNPFMIPGDGNRAEVIRKYEAWLLEKPELVAQAKSELRGKVLGCWCSPEVHK